MPNQLLFFFVNKHNANKQKCHDNSDVSTMNCSMLHCCNSTVPIYSWLVAMKTNNWFITNSKTRNTEMQY